MPGTVQKKVLVVQLWYPAIDSPSCYVLALRLSAERGGFWQSVTGGVEKKEDFADAALREAEEETNLPAHVAHYLGLEHSFAGRWGPALERAYAIRYYGNKKPQPQLSAEHAEYEWLSPEEAIERMRYPHNQEAIKRALTLPPAFYIQASGEWQQAGEKITHARTLTLLQKSLKMNAQKQFYLEHEKERWEIAAADTFLFAERVDLSKGLLQLQNKNWVEIPWDKLFVGKDDVFYGQINTEGFPQAWVRFLRPAYYELAQNFKEKPAGIYACWQKEEFLIKNIRRE